MSNPTPILAAASGSAAEPPLVQTRNALRCGIRLQTSGGSLPLLLPADRPAELRRGMAICSVPNVAPWFFGMANLRGELVPVFDLLGYCGLGRTTRQRSSELLLIGTAASAFALPGTGEPEILQLSEDGAGTHTAPAQVSEFIYNAWKGVNTHWYDFDFDRWLLQLSRGENPLPLPFSPSQTELSS
jgi:hypothetical protein